MSLTCDAPNPDRPEIECDYAPGNHPHHSGLDHTLDPVDYVDWVNLDYTAPALADTQRTSPKLSKLGAQIRAARRSG